MSVDMTEQCLLETLNVHLDVPEIPETASLVDVIRYLNTIFASSQETQPVAQA